MRHTLTLLELSDKDFLRRSNILKISFEYSIAKIFKEYSDYRFIGSIKEFNVDNKFSIEKLIIYPFFVSTSNGHSKYLFELFGDFYAPNIGPVSLEIIRYFFVEKNNSSFFNFKNSSVEVYNTNFKNWDELINSILNQTVIINNNDLLFRDIFILNDIGIQNEIFRSIDSGIKILKEQSGNRFFIFNEYDLEAHSKNYMAFSSKVKTHGKIEYDEIINDKDKIPFYAN